MACSSGFRVRDGRTVVLVGVNHGFQYGASVIPQRHVDDFLDRLRALFAEHHFKALAEEMSEDALLKWKVNETTCRHLANGVEYAMCDPGAGECRDPAYRESVWLAHLQSLDRWPTLFVCGIDHLSTFSDRLRAAGITALVDEKRWHEPSSWEAE